MSYEPPPYVPGDAYSTPHHTPPAPLAQPVYGPPPNPQPPKRPSRTPLVVALVIVGALVLCGGGIALAAVAAKGKPQAKASPSWSSGNLTTTGGPAEPAQQTTYEPPKSQTFNLAVGTDITAETDDGQVVIAVAAATYRKTPCGKYGEKPQSGTYLVVDVTITVTKGTFSINPLYFKISEPDGTTVDTITGVFADCKKLDSGNDIPAPTKRAGQLAFDRTVGPCVLEYDSPQGAPLATWTMPSA